MVGNGERKQRASRDRTVTACFSAALPGRAELSEAPKKTMQEAAL